MAATNGHFKSPPPPQNRKCVFKKDQILNLLSCKGSDSYSALNQGAGPDIMQSLFRR
ncbi:hypothetical protein JOB18_023814 [Solea senegalensis]|uniref:Uncharacterized protein n=1 Tax=Solea senegalensis TaxID=28829 RepID=A0AAV6RHZ6_SOLSE|nr:hypothetical protein JOB18_023814 [Solea senegalensis]